MFDLFKRSTIHVQFIDASTNEKIGVANMKEEQLPLSFSKPVTMQLQNKEWQIIKAEPEDAFQFKETKHLTLWLSRFEKPDPNEIRFSIPTISNETPPSLTESLLADFEITLHEDDWRQIELLPLTLLPAIQEEMTEVEAILFPDDETENKNGYDKIHVRTKIGTTSLNISFDEFCDVVNTSQNGVIKIANVNGTGYVQNGFAIKSANYTYYGTLEDNFIKELCLKSFESMDDEMALVCSKYNLVMIRWLEGSITTI